MRICPTGSRGWNNNRIRWFGQLRNFVAEPLGTFLASVTRQLDDRKGFLRFKQREKALAFEARGEVKGSKRCVAERSGRYILAETEQQFPFRRLAKVVGVLV